MRWLDGMQENSVAMNTLTKNRFSSLVSQRPPQDLARSIWKVIRLAIVGVLLAPLLARAQNTSIPIPLAPGVANVGQGYANAQATRAGNLVALNGVVRPGQGTLATLPPNLRPAAREVFMVITGRHTPARVDVTPDGKISVVTGGSTDSISLSGIVFAVP